MSLTVIHELSTNVWTFSRPFLRFSILPVGGRSTAIRLRDGGVWVLASTHLDDETKAKLDELGEVKYILAGNSVHWLFLGEFKKTYPSAKLIGVGPLLEKPGCPELDGAYGHDAPDTKYGFEDEISACYFTGFKNRDMAFFHHDSKTALAADLLFNLPATEQYSKVLRKPYLLRLSLSPPQWAHQKLVSMLSEDKNAMKRDAETVAAWDFDTFVPCHGEVIQGKGKEAWCTAYKAFL